MGVRSTILNALKTELQGTVNSSSYSFDLAVVTLFDENMLNLPEHRKPMLQILDSEDDISIHEDSTHTVYETFINLFGVVGAGNADDLHNSLANMTALIKQFLASTPSLGSNVYRIKYVKAENRYLEGQRVASTLVSCQILYWCLNGTY